MSNVRFLYDFLSDAAIITSSSEATDHDDDNVADDFVKRTWRATGDTSEWIKFDLGSAQQITVFAMFKHNITSGGTILLQGNATDSWTSPSYSQALTHNTYKIVHFLDQTYRWWRLYITNSANPDGYVQIGRVCIGAYVTTTRNIVERRSRERIDPSVIQEQDRQQPYARIKDKFWEYEIQYRTVERADQDILEAVYEACGITEPLVISLDPDDYPSKDSIYARLLRTLPIEMQLMNYGDVVLTFRELV